MTVEHNLEGASVADMGETGEMRARVIRGRDGGYGERSVVAVEYPGFWARETFLEDHREQGGGWSRTDVPSDGVSSISCQLDPSTTVHFYALVQMSDHHASCKPSHWVKGIIAFVVEAF